MNIVERTCKDIARLDDGGVAIIFLRCDDENDIEQCIKNHIYIYNDETNAYRTIGENIINFSTEDYIKVDNKGFLNNCEMFTDFIKSVNHKTLYIRDIDYFIESYNAQAIVLNQDVNKNNIKGMQYAPLEEILVLISNNKKAGKNNTLFLVRYPTGGIKYKDLEKHSFIYDIPYPDKDEIIEIIKAAADENMNSPQSNSKASEKILPLKINELAEMFRGFRENDIKNTISLACSAEDDPFKSDSKALINQIKETKRQLLEKNGGLQWLDIKTQEVAGLKNMREWLKDRIKIFENPSAAIANEIPLPKGILIAGIPGTGKSLMANETARTLKIPLIRMDIGSLMGKYFGESEENLAKALRLAEATAPNVLWIDELEKSFAGTSGGDDGNATTLRVFSTFLTWMQEKEKLCFVFATANNMQSLPPELSRKGRFNEKFTVFMPSASECEDIFFNHLKKYFRFIPGLEESFEGLSDDERKKQVKDFKDKNIKPIIETAAEYKKFMTGADIGEIVASSFQKLYTKKFDDTYKKKNREESVRMSYKLSEISVSLSDELKSSKTYGENTRNVCDYWLSLVDNNDFTSASKFDTSEESKVWSLYYDKFDKSTGKFVLPEKFEFLSTDNKNKPLNKSLYIDTKKDDYCFNLDKIDKFAMENKIYDMRMFAVYAAKIFDICSLKKSSQSKEEIKGKV